MNNKPNNSKGKFLNFAKAGAVEVVFVVVVIALILGVLNYFNIISLSTLSPQLNFLPHRPLASSKNFTQSPSPQKLILGCPVKKEICNAGKQIFDGNKFLGIGFNIPVPGKIYAAVSGNAVFGGVQDQARGIVSHATIVIGGTEDAKSYTLIYEYFGLPASTVSAKTVSRNEELGTFLGGSFPTKPPYNGINLLLMLKSNTGENIVFSSGDFIR